MKKKYGTVIFLIWMLAMLQLAMTLQTAKSWYGETSGDNPGWNDTVPWSDDGHYVQCHHRCSDPYDDNNVFTSTGFNVHYKTYPKTPYGYDYANWTWTSGVANPDIWEHAQATGDSAFVDLYTGNTYWDESEPQWRTVFWFTGYMRYFNYMSYAFNPRVTYVSACTAAGFYNIQTWEWYAISSTTEPWDYMEATE